ncbi:Clavaminate synthase-like protein [Xylariaceae sp. FL0804]|nr:Clavaminate synthase-like protein [Xylariaceae sp. FL0804]
MAQPTGPQPWKAEDIRRDTSWIQRLTPEEVEGFRTALAHARTLGKPLLKMEQADYPLPDASRLALERAVATTQGRWGLCLVKGFPTDEWSEEEMRVAYWGMGLYMGVGRTQNKASQIISDVRDTGVGYKVKGGRGYNTNAGLDFHQDSCDVVTLLCRRTAKSGGTSMVMSSMALRDRVAELRPDLLPVLEENSWFHSFQDTQDASQPPYYRCPIFGGNGNGNGDEDGGRGRGQPPFCARTNRKNTAAAQRDFPEVPRLTARQSEALDLLDAVMPSPEFCYAMDLERGDLQLLNSYVTLHSRTPFEDHAGGRDPDRKRHLMRLWLAVPSSQPLPPEWAEYYGDARAGAVRGGLRGSAMTPEFLEYEARHARAMGMPFDTWRPMVTKEDMARVVAAR